MVTVSMRKFENQHMACNSAAKISRKLQNHNQCINEKFLLICC